MPKKKQGYGDILKVMDCFFENILLHCFWSLMQNLTSVSSQLAGSILKFTNYNNCTGNSTHTFTSVPLHWQRYRCRCLWIWMQMSILLSLYFYGIIFAALLYNVKLCFSCMTNTFCNFSIIVIQCVGQFVLFLNSVWSPSFSNCVIWPRSLFEQPAELHHGLCD